MTWKLVVAIRSHFGFSVFCIESIRGPLMTNEVIVAGAGIWGCTVARRLAEAGRKVLGLVIGGRLGKYRYYDMDQAMAAALELKI